MKNLFYDNFTRNLYSDGFKNCQLDGVFVKPFDGFIYFIFPIFKYESIQEISYKISSYEQFLKVNFSNFNVNKIVFLKIFIFEEVGVEFFNQFEDKFDIHSNILFIDWAFDLSKNQVLVRQNHISKVLNLNEILESSLYGKEFYKSEGKPTLVYRKNKIFITFSLILVNIIVYLYANIINKNEFSYLVWEFAISSRVIDNFEIYRLFTAMFLHVDFIHLLSNCISLYIFGLIAESLIGKVSFIICYFLGGFTGGILSSIFNSGLSIGASGAIFAIEGALLYFCLKKRKNFKSLNLSRVVIITVVMLFGSFRPDVDNVGHLAGFFGGFILMSLIMFVNKFFKIKG